ncbi:ubiquinone biosynthesis O-methyltransferase-like protein, partial [Leptotrombidium deliense]
KYRSVVLNNVNQLRCSSQEATDEVWKFSRYKDWWNNPGLKALRAMNELRVPLIVNHLTGKEQKTVHPLKGYRLLDVGSGGGLLCEPLARLGGEVTGIEPNSDSVNYCNNRLDGPSTDLKSNLKYVVSTIEEFASKENKAQFDAVIASEVVEHIEDVESVIKSAHELLKPNGLFFITTINQTITAYLVAIFAAENLLGIIPKGTHHYDLLVPSLSLKVMLEKSK